MHGVLVRPRGPKGHVLAAGVLVVAAVLGPLIAPTPAPAATNAIFTVAGNGPAAVKATGARRSPQS
jgi:hypothetical protein